MSHFITIFLSGDVMTGRGIDQILPHPSEPAIFEPYLRDARGYVMLAERAAGSIAKPVGYGYPWGEALAILEKRAPDLRIINLESSITTSNDYWQGKGINYRMHPANVPCLTEAGIDACALANNHVLDWGYAGLTETLAVLGEAGVKTAGAGSNYHEAASPVMLPVTGKGRVLLFSFGLETSGIPNAWKATTDRCGINLLPDLSPATISRIASQVRGVKGAGDIVIASIHWGSNWGFEVPPDQRQFAHRLIEAASVDLVHGHSSHHVKGIEVYQGKGVIYGCGDFINDYEGISGYEEFRGDLSLMYFPQIEAATGKLARLTMVPVRRHKFRLQLANATEAEWLATTLNREGKVFGTSVSIEEDGSFDLQHED
ncbi:MAG TPA: CapA family protein [Geomonas sp.]|nr:CapA family protein [Geomonas sp.]